MEDVSGADYMLAKRVFKDFARKTLGEYYDFYAQRDKFENFRNMCLKIYKFDPGNFFQLLD